MNFFKELGQNQDKVEAFNNKTKGTFLWILGTVNSIPLLLLVISFFLPICKVEFFDYVESYTFVDLLAESSSTLITYELTNLLCIAPLAIYAIFRIKLINETTEKRVAYGWMLFSMLGMLIFTIVLASIQPQVAVLASDLEISERIVEAGAGSVMMYVSLIIISVISLIEGCTLFHIFEGKINLDEMPKLFNPDFLIKKTTSTVENTAEESKDTATEKEHRTDKVKIAADEMRELKKLLDEGIITEEEFEAKKKELLGL